MSVAAVEQVKQLIDELSITEQIRVAEWLEVILGRKLNATKPAKRKKVSKTAKAAKLTALTLNGSTNHALNAEIPWEKRPWTQEEIRQLMKPDPKTGAEIAAWLRANPDAGEWGEKDIPDVVEWVSELRHKISKRQEWDE